MSDDFFLQKLRWLIVFASIFDFSSLSDRGLFQALNEDNTAHSNFITIARSATCIYYQVKRQILIIGIFQDVFISWCPYIFQKQYLIQISAAFQATVTNEWRMIHERYVILIWNYYAYQCYILMPSLSISVSRSRSILPVIELCTELRSPHLTLFTYIPFDYCQNIFKTRIFYSHLRSSSWLSELHIAIFLW